MNNDEDSDERRRVGMALHDAIERLPDNVNSVGPHVALDVLKEMADINRRAVTEEGRGPLQCWDGEPILVQVGNR
jgi:hypothetical protein